MNFRLLRILEFSSKYILRGRDPGKGIVLALTPSPPHDIYLF